MYFSCSYLLSKNPDVDSCGYSMPHPSEPKLHIRVQTKVRLWPLAHTLTRPQGKPALEVMQEALAALSEISAHILTTFDASMAKYRAKHPVIASDRSDRSDRMEA